MVRGAFKKYDADGSGMMTIEEVRELAKNGSAIGIEYDENDFDHALDLVNTTSEYALTGAVIAQDRYAITQATDYLRHSAGNFYINDKPTGAVVGQQPFGGSRASGTNDKAGSKANLLRWTSTRTIKETLVPIKDYRYPFLSEE